MSSKRLNYQGQAFSDADLQDLPLKEVVYPYEEVNFSQNRLSAEGLRKVLELCSRCEKLRVLKLYKNDINDDGAQALSRFVRKCYTLEELHLSHNRFTERGVELLVRAAEEARTQAKSSVPLWTRLEQNEVKNPDKVLEYLTKEYSVCGRKHRDLCSTKHCHYGAKVHLPHFHFQRDEFGHANNDGPRKRKWAPPPEPVEDTDPWKDTDWREGRDDWFDGCPEAFRKVPEWEEPARKKWRTEEEDWDGTGEPRPSGVKMSGGIFMRAMGAIVAKKDDDDGARPENEPSKPSRPPRVQNNVASRTLSQLGVLAGERRKAKVLLKEAPRGPVKKEDDLDDEDEDKDVEEEDVDEAEEASEAEKEAEEEEEMEDEEEEVAEPKRRGQEREEDDHYSSRRPPEDRKSVV